MHAHLDADLELPAIVAPAGALRIERVAWLERRQAEIDWERDQAYDDDLIPAHELAQLRRSAR